MILYVNVCVRTESRTDRLAKALLNKLFQTVQAVCGSRLDSGIRPILGRPVPCHFENVSREYLFDRHCIRI